MRYTQRAMNKAQNLLEMNGLPGEAMKWIIRGEKLLAIKAIRDEYWDPVTKKGLELPVCKYMVEYVWNGAELHKQTVAELNAYIDSTR